MSNEIETVAQFLGLSGKRIDKDKIDNLKRADAFKTEVSDRLIKAPTFLLDVAPDSTWKTLSSILDIKLANVVGWAWNTRRELLACCDPKYKPEDVVDCTLHHQDVVWGRKPKLSVLLDGAQIGELEFTVHLTLAIDAGVLHVQNKRIIGGKLGKCRGIGLLKCANVVLIEPKTEEFDFPAFTFDEGIPIKATPSAVAA